MCSRKPIKDRLLPDGADVTAQHAEPPAEDDLWFLPGPAEEAPGFLPPGPQADPRESALASDWTQAQASSAAQLAHVAGRLGALDDRLLRGPQGWRHRLALIEAAELGWLNGDRIGADRLALWVALRLSGVQEDMGALARTGWAVRRLNGGPGPEAGLADFLGRHDPENRSDQDVRIAEHVAGWHEVMEWASDLHPISRACMGYHLWPFAGLGAQGEKVEAAVTAARIAAAAGTGAVFAPLAMGGAGALRADGPPAARLRRWLDGIEGAILTAMRHLDDIERWDARAGRVMARLSGRTPPALRVALAEWPILSAPMAEKLTGASRAAVQRNLAWMEARGLIREVTGQGRFRMWRAVAGADR